MQVTAYKLHPVNASGSRWTSLFFWGGRGAGAENEVGDLPGEQMFQFAALL